MGFHFGFKNISLLKIIKGTRVRNGITGLPYILHFMHDVWLIVCCLSHKNRPECSFLQEITKIATDDL